MELKFPEEFFAQRERAKAGRDPACTDETLAFLLNEAEKIGAKTCLEIGAAEGLTSVALCLAGRKVVCIEKDPLRARAARENFSRFRVEESVTLHEGDAGEILPLMEGQFDLIFLDGPKAQYKTYLPECKRLLRRGGALLSDDVLLFGWVRGEPPKKRRMLAVHLREYLSMLENDPDFETEILEIGEGLALSVRK